MSGPAERTERCRRCGRMFYWLTCFAPTYGNVCSDCFHEWVHNIPLVEPETPAPVCTVCGSHINPDYGTGPVCGACLEDEAVMSPPHYTAGGIETIDFIRAKLTPDEFRGFCKGSIIKYLSRANLKGSEDEDYRKASFYGRMLAGDDPRGGAK